MRLVWPLIGRADELRLVDAAMRRSGGARGLVLAGAPGVGKTRLAREAVARAGQRGMSVRWVTATASAGGLPLGAFAALVGAVGGDPIQVLRRVRDALLEGAGQAGLVVGVDDAHQLDEVSALLVHQLVLAKAATVVVTVRTGEPAPDAVTGLWKDGQLDRLEVRPLAKPETGSLLEAVLGGPVDSASAGRLWALTKGNVLFLRHLVEGELEAKRLVEVRGVWRWSKEPTLPPGLAELVTARIGRLSEPIRDVVDVLALGEPLGIAELGELTDPLAVEEAEDRGLVQVERDGRRLSARLAHPLYGEARRDVMGLVRSRRLRGRISQVLAGAHHPDNTLRRAVLAMDSDLEPDPDLLTGAALLATKLSDLSLAEQLARAAVNAGGTFDSHYVLAYTLSLSARGVETERELATLDQFADNDLKRALITIPRVGNLFWMLGQPDEAERVLDRVEAMVTDDTCRAVLTSMRAAFHAFLGRPHEAVRSASSALAADTLSDQAVVFATWGLVLGLGVLGRIDEARLVAARGYEAASRIAEGTILGMALSELYTVGLRLAGDLHEVESLSRQHQERGSDYVGLAQVMCVILLGHAELAQGHLRTSIRWLREGRAGLVGNGLGDLGGWGYQCLLRLTQAWAMTGDAGAARQALVALDSERHPAYVILEPEHMLARAWVAAAEGTVREALTVARAAAAHAARRDQFAQELLALHTAVCFGDDTAAARLAELAKQVSGPRARAAARHAAALAADDGNGLHHSSVRLEEMGDRLAAADAAAQAAVAHTRRGQTSAAKAAAARAQRLAQACQGARTPALVAVARPLPLTKREREVVTLAAQGLSNRDIANRLVVSVRTVEGHLYRACSKLGTSNRAEFADLLRNA